MHSTPPHASLTPSRDTMTTFRSPGNRPTSSEALQKEARVWLRTLTSGEVKPWDAEGFKRWLSTSPAHQAAFYEVKQRWEALKPGVGEMLRSNPEAAQFHEQALRGLGPVRGRRAFLGAAFSAAAVAGVAVVYPPGELWPSPGEWGADFRTATGEQRQIILGARVHVTLNTQTSIRHSAQGDQTSGIDLLAGEAAIDLSAAREPFTVNAGAGRSQAESGRFEVRFLAGRACVTCIEGAVRVEHPAGVLALQAAQQAIYDARSLSSVARIDPASASAWRKGELVFSQTRLIDVLDEINRYRSGRVVLMNDAVRNRPVSGRFVIASLDSALAQLQHTFDLHARSLPAGLLILS